MASLNKQLERTLFEVESEMTAFRFFFTVACIYYLNLTKEKKNVPENGNNAIIVGCQSATKMLDTRSKFC